MHAISHDYGDVETHIAFVHGLSGHTKLTWTADGSNSPVLWPTWLAEDIPGIGLWLIGYPAAKTDWRGHAMPLSDRADNILARLLAEPRLERGNIIFVAHSLGGLVIEQLLRNAIRDSQSNSRAADLHSRVRRIAFLGTPHRGALLASIGKALSLLIRPSAATRDLTLGGSQLRELNFWYRQYSRDQGIENLLLVEGRPKRILGFSLPRILGTIVSPSSADAGLPELPITVDESHTTICKPASRDAEVYVLLKAFVSRPFEEPPRAARMAEAIERSTTQLEELAASNREQTKAIKKFAQKIAQGSPPPVIDTTVIDAEVCRQLDRLRKCRLFAGYSASEEARRLLANVLSGGLALASSKQKDEALAWCARILSTSHPDEAEEALDSIAVPDQELVAIARGLVAQGRGRLAEALGQMSSVSTPMCRGGAYICVLKEKGYEEAREWLHKAGFTITDLDSDAKFFYLNGALENADWAEAFEVAKTLTDGACPDFCV